MGAGASCQTDGSSVSALTARFGSVAFSSLPGGKLTSLTFRGVSDTGGVTGLTAGGWLTFYGWRK